MAKTTVVDRRSLENARILVVDDEVAAQASLERLLESEGAEVLCVRTVEEVRRLAPLILVDAAVVDYWLLDEVGLDAVRLLRRQVEPCASVMVTGTLDPALVLECISEGAFDVLLKPFAGDAFVAAVRNAVRRTHTWRATIASTPSAHVRDRRFRTHGDPLADSTGEQRTQRQTALDQKARDLARTRKLSKKETEIFVHVVRGLRNLEIAKAEGIAERTVKFHVANVMTKFGVRSRADLILLVFFDDP